LVNQLSEKGAFVVNFYSIAYKGLLVGNGKMCGGVYVDNKAHDVAALKIIVEEAGGKVTDLNGSDQRYDEDVFGCIFSNGKIHDELVSIAKNTISER
jgi:fructose-1,6-bisphosphatase/inositol monophosphatase family enzyme